MPKKSEEHSTADSPFSSGPNQHNALPLADLSILQSHLFMSYLTPKLINPHWKDVEQFRRRRYLISFMHQCMGCFWWASPGAVNEALQKAAPCWLGRPFNNMTTLIVSNKNTAAQKHRTAKCYVKPPKAMMHWPWTNLEQYPWRHSNLNW